MSDNQFSVWSLLGKDMYYEHYRLSPHLQEFRVWLDSTYSADNTATFLDKDFLHQLRNNDFFARLWELELARWLIATGLKLLPKKGKGPDFCI